MGIDRDRIINAGFLKRLEEAEGRVNHLLADIRADSKPDHTFAESDLHDKVEAYCRYHGWYYVHQRMDKATRCGVGTPDFIIACPKGITLWLELKRPKGKATAPQLAANTQLHRFGHIAEIMDNWSDVLNLLERYQI